MQMIKYKWNSVDDIMQPFMFLSDSGKIKKAKLFDEDISMRIGDRTCIGHFSKSKHVQCKEKRAVTGEWNCNECKLRDDFFMCMPCDGTECINSKQRHGCEESKYYIYLAAFDSVLKVGISQQFRIMERLIEQGADFGAKIAYMKDGKDVRVVEQEIRSKLDIVDRMTGDQKQKMIFANPNTCVSNIISAINKLKSNGISKYMITPEIYDLRNHYRLANVHHDPRRARISDGTHIEGSVVAAKGNIIIMNDVKGFFSFNAHDLIGREIEITNN